MQNKEKIKAAPKHANSAKRTREETESPTSSDTKVQHICIFDWDDTLFCTSSFLPKNEIEMKRLKQEHSAILAKLDDAAARVLLKSLKVPNTQTVIITNA